ncbi:MAG TPA: co-chaperone YbbN [Gammaproteobacteria bacterium]
MHSIDVSVQNFNTEVIEKSQTVPVVVDFWAPWCGPCRVLKPILEKLAEEYQGKFILAKVNSDENQALAGQFGVRGIPSVKAIYQGKIINEFSGALPEPAVREFLDRIIPNDSELNRQQAMSCYEKGDSKAALVLLDKAIELDPNNHTAKINKATLLFESNDLQAAKDLIAQLPVNIQLAESVKELLAKLELAARTQALPDKQTLLAQIQQDDMNLQARLDLASHYINEQAYDQALELLFAVLKKDRHYQDEIARKTILSVFTLLGPQDPRVRAARKTLASLLN